MHASERWDVMIVETELDKPLELLGRDPERLRVQIVNTGGNLVVINSTREALATPPYGFILTPGASLALDTTAPIWAMSADSPAGGGPGELSIIFESGSVTA
jgi:hypothetical protein